MDPKALQRLLEALAEQEYTALMKRLGVGS